MGDKPLFSASARGIASSAEAKARIAYCSMDAIWWISVRGCVGKIEATVTLTNLVCSLGYSDRAADLSGTPAVDDTVIDNEIACGADGIVQGAFGLVDNLRESTALRNSLKPTR